MNPVLSRALALLLPATVLAVPAAAHADPAYDGLRINEVNSNLAPGDWVEVTNIGDGPIDLSGVVLKDDSDARTDAIAAGTVLEPGEFLHLSQGTHFSFGLGAADEFRLFTPGGSTLIDRYAWTGHAITDGRCPDGTGDFVTGLAPTPGAANACPRPYDGLRINEVNSNLAPGDWVEITNIGDTPVDLSGVVLMDDSARTDAIAAGTTLAPGAFLQLSQGTHFSFGLGGTDEFRLFEPDGTTLIDRHSWVGHAITDGRCPDGLGPFQRGLPPTPGAPNDCPDLYGDIRINEVNSNVAPGDWVEVTNVGTEPVDLAGVVMRDDNNTRTDALPAGTIVEPGGFLQLSEGVHFFFGLGSADEFRLFEPGGLTLIDRYAWTGHAAVDGRCPDGLGDFVKGLAPTPGAPNACRGVVINEIESNGDIFDWVEVTNTSAAAIDISGYVVRDNNDANGLAFPEGSVLAPGAFLTLDTNDPAVTGNFGLGSPDSARLYRADGTTLVDSYSWEPHAATSYGRCPDGVGPFVTTRSTTKGAANDCASPVVVNEVTTTGTATDFVELANPSSQPADVSGFLIGDAGETRVAVAGGTVVPAGGRVAVDVSTASLPTPLTFDAADSVRLFEPGGTTLVDSYAWTARATTSYGRCPDSVGEFAETSRATAGTTNACPGELTPEAWPGGAEVANAGVANFFGSDLSGLSFAPGEPDVLWGVRNGDGRLFRLVPDAEGRWVADTADGWSAGKPLRFAGGTGTLDAEGVAMVGTTAYVAIERDQTGVSRPSVLSYDVTAAGAELPATREWNLAADLPVLGPNLGLEGIAWVPDAELVERGFRDERLGKTYDPADYAGNGGGLTFVVAESTVLDGRVLAYALLADGTFHRVATIETPFVTGMELEWEGDTGRLWAVCDDTCFGRTAPLEIAETGDDAGRFVATAIYERPAGMPNLNNEGFAITPGSECVDGRKPVFWSDDSQTGGHALRSGTLDCVVPEPEPEPEPAVAELTATVAPRQVRAGAGRVAVRVTVTSAGETTPSGQVRLRDGGRVLATGTLNPAGSVTLTVGPFRTPGRVTLTAEYVGDAATRPASATVPLTVQKATARVVAKGPWTTRSGAKARVVVQVRSALAPTGRVRVALGKGTVVRAVVRKGRATVVLPRGLKPGRRTVTVRYVGNPRVAAATTRVRLVVRR